MLSLDLDALAFLIKSLPLLVAALIVLHVGYSFLGLSKIKSLARSLFSLFIIWYCIFPTWS